MCHLSVGCVVTAVCGLILMSSGGWADDSGLVARYCFDEPAGETVLDQSGHGHAGRVCGAVRVPSPRGQALRFDGRDDYVDCGGPEGLQLSGDLTIEAWVRPTDLSGRNRLILGDTASLSVLRNYSLRFDAGGFFYEHGNNRDSTNAFCASLPPLNEWSHVAMVVEHPRYYLYLNGRLLQSGETAIAPRPTNGSARRIGGWGAGWFQGDIDEVGLYNRALPERVIMAHAGLAPQVRVDVQPALIYAQQRLTGEVVFNGDLPPGASVVAMVLRGETEVAREALQPVETRRGSERWRSSVEFATQSFEGGEDTLLVEVRGPAEELVAAGQGALAYPVRPPHWFRSQAGVSDEPPAPFGPVTDGYDVCGRRYALGEGPVFSQIEALRKPLLAGPMRLVSPSAVTGEVKTEYDGFARFDWTVKPHPGQSTLEGLVLEIPLLPEVARYLYTWPNAYSRQLQADYESAFQPIVWLGDEEKGLSWLCESDENWRPADPQRAVQVLRGERETVLRVTFVDQPVPLPDEGLRYTFALQATPVRPPGRDTWDQRIYADTWCAEGLGLPQRQVNGMPALQWYAKKGVRAVVIVRWWEAFAYTSPIGHEEEFRELVRACHAVGIKVLPYVGGFILSELAPEAAFAKVEMVKQPLVNYPVRAPNLTPQRGFVACPQGSWQDFLADGIARLIDEYDVDGVYLDSSASPRPCRNELHGCGYTRPDGVRSPTYPVFAVRRNHQRIYNVVKARKPDGLIDLHVSNCMNGLALSYVTSYWVGEHMPAAAFKPDVLPLDRFRTEFMGANWGVPSDMLFYTMRDYRKCCALAVLHDVPVRVDNVTQLDLQSQLWELHDRYPYKQAEWLPYWRNDGCVKVSPEGCYASLYRHDHEGVLTFVSNLSREDGEVRAELNLTKLGLTGEVSAEDALTGAPLTMQDGVLTVNLASQDWVAALIRRAAQ